VSAHHGAMRIGDQTGPSLAAGAQLKRHRLPRVIVLALAVTLAGCSTLLPVASDATRVPWERFDDARTAIERLEPYRSHRDELLSDGFDPYQNPSVTILSWPDLLQRFANVHALKGSELDHGLQQCLLAGNRCSGLSINVRKIRRERKGNFWLDSLAFRREVSVTGWTFNALIVFVDDVVVYRVFGGQPKLEEFSITRNPLGPIQGWGDAIGASMLR
jgi:hypothetical protein